MSTFTFRVPDTAAKCRAKLPELDAELRYTSPQAVKWMRAILADAVADEAGWTSRDLFGGLVTVHDANRYDEYRAHAARGELRWGPASVR